MVGNFNDVKLNQEPMMYFTVRDGFGDNVGAEKYVKFDDAAKALKAFCGDYRNDVDGAMLGIVYKGEDRDYKCVLVQNHMTSVGNRFRSMYRNITERALAIPEIELAALRGVQMEFPFDEATQKKIDELEKRLGLYERDVDVSGDLYTGKWRVHIVPPGGRYGHNNNVIHDGNYSMVEFWDMSQRKEDFPNGQFVSSYSVGGLLSDSFGVSPEVMMRHGLCLDYENRDVWSVSGAEMRRVFDWFKHRELQVGERYLDVQFGVTFRYFSDFQKAEEFAEMKLNKIPLVRDVHIGGSLEKPSEDGFPGVFVGAVFKSQADKESVKREIAKCFAGFQYEVACTEKVVEAEKLPLDQIIGDCEKVSKSQNVNKKDKMFEERNR